MPPFCVLHVCMGNICRSPMAERILAHRVAQRAGDDADDLLMSHSCGVGSWHAGQRMDSSAARELRNRQIGSEGFSARQIERAHIEISDLILTATTEQYDYVSITFPEARERTFLIRHFGAIVAGMDASKLPESDGSAQAVHARGQAVVNEANEHRDEFEAQSLDDPWGSSGATFTRVAEEIDTALAPFVTKLLS